MEINLVALFTSASDHLGQLSLQQLSCRTLWNIFYKSDRLRTFVVGQSRFTKLDHVSFRRFTSLSKHYKTRDLFSVKIIWNTDNRSRCDRWMLIKHFVYLSRINILTTANDHV